MANPLDTLQSSRRPQCSNASVRTTWLYRPDAIQCLTSIRVSDSRHSYGKTAATVWTMFSIRQDVHKKFNCPDVSLHGPDDQASYMEIACTSSTVWTSAFRVRTLQSLIMVITCRRRATVRTLGKQRLDAALLWKAFSATLERRLQLTVQTLGQAVRTPSGILVITFYSNIGLG